MATNKNNPDNKRVGVSYIATFYQEVASLTQMYSQYLNLKLQLKMTYKQDIGSEYMSMSEEDKNALNITLQSIRHFSHKSVVQYKAIKKIIEPEGKKETKDEILIIYNEEIRKVYVIDEDKLEKFVELLNSCLVQEVVQGLLETNKDIVASIYGQPA